MNNEVTIGIHVDKNMALSDFATIDGKARKLGDDITGRLARRGPAAGASLGEGIFDGLKSSLSRGGPALAPVLAGVAIGAAPLIGATISSAVIGGAGFGGVIGGVMLAARHPAIQAAGKDLGQGLLSDLTRRADVFIEPIMRSIDIVKDSAASMGTDFSRIFNNSSRFLEPLVRGATSAIRSITHGIADLTDGAGPVIEELSNGVAKVGDAFGDVFSQMKEDGVSAAVALDSVFNMVATTIRIAGDALHGLTETYGFLAKLGVFGHEAQIEFIRLEANTKLATEATEELTGGLLSTAEAAGVAGQKMMTYGEAMEAAAGKGRSLFDSQTNVAEAIRGAEDALRENGKGLDTNTEKQLDNRKALSKVAAELTDYYDAYVKANGEGGAAAGIAERNRSSFVRLARQFGLSAKEAGNLADQMGLIKSKKIDFYANTHDAAGRLDALKDKVASVKGKTIEVHVSVTGTERLSATGHRIGGYEHGGIVGAATGGLHGGLRMVGEHGPELLELPPGTRVNSNPDTQRLMAGAGAGSLPPIVVQLVADGKVLAQTMVEPMRGLIRGQGRGSVQGFLGQPGAA